MGVSLQGLNVGIISVGASGTGKTSTFEGSQSEQGIVNFFVDGLFTGIADKAQVYLYSIIYFNRAIQKVVVHINLLSRLNSLK